MSLTTTVLMFSPETVLNGTVNEDILLIYVALLRRKVRSPLITASRLLSLLRLPLQFTKYVVASSNELLVVSVRR